MSPELLFGWHLRLDVLVWPWRISEINFPDLSSTFQACRVRPAGHCVVSIVLMISDSGLNVLETSSGLGFFDDFSMGKIQMDWISSIFPGMSGEN